MKVVRHEKARYKARDGYFRTSIKTLREIAKATESFQHVAGYLVLASFANGRPPEGLEAHRYTGAGTPSMLDRLTIGRDKTIKVRNDLMQGGWIADVPKDFGQRKWARYKLTHQKLDLDLSHAIVDGLFANGNLVDSAIRRIEKCDFPKNEDMTDSDHHHASMLIRLDALMLMLELYAHTSMIQYGGVDPKQLCGLWHLKDVSKDGFCLQEEPIESNLDGAYYTWNVQPSGEWTASLHAEGYTALTHRDRFWSALRVLRDKGLFYKAVTLFEDDPVRVLNAIATVTLRVNDAHADKGRSGDPSLLSTYESLGWTDHGYYNLGYSPLNDYDTTEWMRVDLPNRKGQIVTIFRPRFRAWNSDNGQWKEKEQHQINQIVQHLENCDDNG